MNSSTRCSATTLLLAGLIALSSCSKERGADPLKAESTTPAAPKYTKLTDAPESERHELDAFGKQLEADLRAKNIAGVKAAFYGPGLLEQIMTGVTASGSNVEKFKSGMERGLVGSFDFVAKSWSEQDPKYKHLVVHEGKVRLRFRFASDAAGITIVDLLVTKRPDGKLGIVDAYNHAMGSGMAEQGRQAALPTLMELDKGFLERMLGESSDGTFKDLEIFGDMSENFRKQNFQGIIDSYHKLSPEMKSNTLATALHLGALQQNEDDEAYKNALKEAAKTNKSANFQFMLVDLYFLEKNYDKAIECLESFMAAVEKDAALLTLKGLLQMSKGSHETARTTVKEALALEPDSVYVHNKAVDVFLAANDYTGVAASMRFLEENTELKFKGGLTDPAWADFLKSPESEPWR